ncbi:hypothetical protein RRG08_019686 [Elysia crispata]|uniref:Uncharacterized protein n=1 Tax=Elysia crispata TaxID=231223 RepID=A0AAE0XRS9_9GAST|nr:hypothetical protein RRG08_019686 [Elysia crispata]
MNAGEGEVVRGCVWICDVESPDTIDISKAYRRSREKPCGHELDRQIPWLACSDLFQRLGLSQEQCLKKFELSSSELSACRLPSSA